MRYFIDTEFYEDGTFIHPLSIGIVAEDGRELYLEIMNGVPAAIPDHHFVKEFVLPHLCPYSATASEREAYRNLYRMAPDTHRQVFTSYLVEELLRWLDGDTEPEFYGYFADYDWVLLCQRFGTMVHLPEHFPKWCRDLKQMAWERGRDYQWIHTHVAQPANPHHALEDARWCADLYARLTQAVDVRFVPAMGKAHGMFTGFDIPLEGIEVMAGALQAFLATPEGPEENSVSKGYRMVGRIMLGAMYRAKATPNSTTVRVTPAAR